MQTCPNNGDAEGATKIATIFFVGPIAKATKNSYGLRVWLSPIVIFLVVAQRSDSLFFFFFLQLSPQDAMCFL